MHIMYIERNDTMQNISIRDYVISNFKDSNKEDFQKAIEQSVSSKDEEALPGMGVFFDILWEHCDQNIKENILNVLETNIKKA